MAKSKKGKQKQDEPAIKNTQTQSSTVEQADVRVVPDDTLNRNSFAEVQDNTWGPTTPAAWVAPPDTEPQEENWPVQDTETWDTAEALLQPPSTQSHNGLSTIHEQPPSGNFTQNRLSEIEESPDEYDQSWHNSDANSAHHSESQTVTPTALSFTGSPTLPSVHSNSMLQEAMKAILTQGISTASEAARKIEKVKAVQFREPVITANVEMSNPQVAPHQGSSSASAAAAAAKSSGKQVHAPNPGQKASNPTTIPWSYPKGSKPGTRHPAPMPVDPSWISTGGNAWSNKHRNGFQNQSWSPGNEYLRTQYLPQPQFQQPQFQQSQFQQPQFQPQFQQPQFQQHAQHTQQARQSHHAQRPQAHQRHHSYPTQPETHHSQSIRPLHKVQTKARQDWQDWGKDQWDRETETDSEDETATGWDEGDQWGRSGGEEWGQNQNATGGEWGQGVGGVGQGVAGGRAQNGWGAGEGRNQNAGGGWGQDAGEGRGQHTAGGWNQGEAEGWGQSAAEGWGGQDTGEAWGQSAGGWAQEPTNPKKKDDRMHKSHGKKGGDEWSQGHEISGQKGQKQKGQKHQGQKHQGNAWADASDPWSQNGQESTKKQTRDAWGQDTNHQSGQGGDVWGASTWDQVTNHRDGQGGDTWGQGVSTWAQDAGENQKNVAWGDEAQKLPKVTAAASSEAVGSRNVLSAQQRSQILSNLLNQTQTQNVKVAQSAVKHGTQKKPEHEQWGAWEARDHGWGSEDGDDTDDTRRVRFSPKASELWGESPRSIPSKTLARAQQGMTTTSVNDPNNVRFLESKGAAFEYVTNAFFGNSRLARERIHWLFPSDKDPRVAGMLAWVQKLSYNLGTFGLIKFLQHRERGGLFINSIFRMRHNPKEPALDWLTFNELQGTMDKTLQESVAFYDPSAQVMVFVYLPSESGNSIAIWRVKINVPDKTRLKYHAEINAIVKTLRKHTEYIVCVDERPPKKKPVQKTAAVLRKGSVKATKNSLPAQPKEKRKWWQFF